MHSNKYKHAWYWFNNSHEIYFGIVKFGETKMLLSDETNIHMLSVKVFNAFNAVRRVQTTCQKCNKIWNKCQNCGIS